MRSCARSRRNGRKAIAWEATAKRSTPEFFAAHTVAELSGWIDYGLETAGRLTNEALVDPDAIFMCRIIIGVP
jgi:hypothetical protein